jgi:iron complex outermembrane receptor protein
MPGVRVPVMAAVVCTLPATLVIQLAAAEGAAGDDAEPAQVVITGTRVQNRSALGTAVPIDVITSDVFRNRGVPEISQALSEALPSFNYPRPGLSDATDTVRPATLRGLSPDETLVLVNGKHRQSAALVNINATVGRGATSVDLNTIPDAIVRSVEVLRDGASAQYGSDAIAGVIDLRLREDRDGGAATASYGVHETTYDILTGRAPAGAGWSVPAKISRSRTDGGILTLSAWKGLPLHVRPSRYCRPGRGKPARSVSGSGSARGQHHRDAVLLQLFPVRSLGPLPVRPFELRLLSGQ